MSVSLVEAKEEKDIVGRGSGGKERRWGNEKIENSYGGRNFYDLGNPIDLARSVSMPCDVHKKNYSRNEITSYETCHPLCTKLLTSHKIC